jgi:hypothetical protein
MADLPWKGTSLQRWSRESESWKNGPNGDDDLGMHFVRVGCDSKLLKGGLRR